MQWLWEKVYLSVGRLQWGGEGEQAERTCAQWASFRRPWRCSVGVELWCVDCVKGFQLDLKRDLEHRKKPTVQFWSLWKGEGLWSLSSKGWRCGSADEAAASASADSTLCSLDFHRNKQFFQNLKKKNSYKYYFLAQINVQERSRPPVSVGQQRWVDRMVVQSGPRPG